MKKIRGCLVAFLTMLGFVTPISAEANYWNSVSEDTPIILKHNIEVQQDNAVNAFNDEQFNETKLYHYSHRSHSSHYSHYSHRSHYSHYSSY